MTCSNCTFKEWYEFDDASVTRVEPAAVTNAEAYVLFYRQALFHRKGFGRLI